MLLQSQLLHRLSKKQKQKWNNELMDEVELKIYNYQKYIQDYLKGIWNKDEKVWVFQNYLYNVEMPAKTVFEFYTCNPQVPSNNYEWSCEKDLIPREDLPQLILKCMKKDKRGNGVGRAEKVVRYVFDILNHPLDILFVKRQMLKESTGVGNEYVYPLLVNVQTLYLAACLENQVRIPLEISLGCINNFPVSINGIKGSIKERLSKNSEYLLTFILMDQEKFISELQYKQDNELNSLRQPHNLIYFLTAILLEVGTNTWAEINIRNFPIKKWKILFNEAWATFHDKSKRSDKSARTLALSYLFELKTGLKLNQHTFGNFDEKNEIETMLIQFKLYLMQKKVSLIEYSALKYILIKCDLTKIEELTINNLKETVDKYFEFCNGNNLQRNTTVAPRIRSFCNGLKTIKELFERENSLGVRYDFPYHEHEIQIAGDTEHDTLFRYAFEKLDTYSLATDEGTFKEDILKVDAIARAIKNYKMKNRKEENIIDYFNELQKITMLRILVESGIRISEVINIPYHFIGRVDEEDIDILVLSLNKLGEEFGVVPISKETAVMFYECIEIRKTYFLNTIQDIDLWDENHVKPDLKYALQFFYIYNKKNNIGNFKGNYFLPIVLTDFLDEICDENKIERTKGKRFHMFRHRAAEYFFFCMSYYDDFDFKDDEEYKTEVIKKLLRHLDVGMTERYSWGSLLNRIAEKRLVFLKSLPSLASWNSPDSEVHKQSVIDKINQDLKGMLTQNSIDRIGKLLTAPAGLLKESVINELSKNQSFKIILNNLRKIDGNKGAVPNGYAYFGMCTQFNCPKLKNREKMTCESCDELLLDTNHIIHLIGTIVRCQESLYSYGKSYIDDVNHYNHVHSLRARSINAQNKLFNEFNFSVDELLELIAQYYEGALKLEV